MADQVASNIRDRWQRGQAPDLVSLLAENPELRSHRSVFLDLAHEEFCRRLNAGEAVDTDEFCKQFPSFQSSLFMLIEVDRLLHANPESGSPRGVSLWPTPEETFLGYLLLAEIGCGSFARVFLASEPALGGRLVVLKIAPQGGMEAEVAGRLQHPNIMPIHSVKEDPDTGLTAICMPYFGRATLCSVLDHAFSDGKASASDRAFLDAISEVLDAPVTPESPALDRRLCRGSYVEAVVHVIAQLADALAYTHARGICHRDLKPSNVLLSTEGRPLLLDFNLSADGELNAWRVGGTLPYMAPEQLRVVAQRKTGRVELPDPRSDIFSLGVIAYQLLCGTLPYGSLPRGDSLEEVAEELLKQHEAGPRSLRERNRQVDYSLASTIEACLAFQPNDRPQSAGELAQSLRKQLSLPRRGRRWVRNHPRRILAAGTAVLLATLAAGLFLASRDPYSVRQYKQGLDYAQQGRYELAVRSYDNAVNAAPADPDVLFARGRARQKLGLYDMAAVDFNEARKIEPRAELYACLGFCASKLDRHKIAGTHYLEAFESGFRSPGILNDLGHECIRLNRYDEAEQYLNEALEMAPDLQVAHNNLVLLHLRRAYAGETITELMLRHAKRVAETAQPSDELLRHIVTLFGKAGKRDPRWVQPAKNLLLSPVSHHLNPKTIDADPELSYLFDDPRIQALCDRPVSRSPQRQSLWIVDPIEND